MPFLSMALQEPVFMHIFDSQMKIYFILFIKIGKTFTYKTILANVRSKKKIALAVASSGIAA